MGTDAPVKLEWHYKLGYEKIKKKREKRRKNGLHNVDFGGH